MRTARRERRPGAGRSFGGEGSPAARPSVSSGGRRTTAWRGRPGPWCGDPPPASHPQTRAGPRPGAGAIPRSTRARRGRCARGRGLPCDGESAGRARRSLSSSGTRAPRGPALCSAAPRPPRRRARWRHSSESHRSHRVGIPAGCCPCGASTSGGRRR